MNIFLYLRRHRAECLLCAILALSAFLNIWNIWNQGDTNYYYSAAVKSMLVNPVAGFFNSFDPAGFITVDKPPVGLWVQAAFAAVLGFHDWILILPQALAGIGSVALIYFIVSRPFGKPAGFVAALALALTPIFVAIARNGTMDSQLIFVLLLAVWAVLRAARERSLPWFLVSAILIGIGFNIKLIQAYIIVPAVLGVYIIGTTDYTWKKRILHVGLAVLVLLAVSLSWAAVVDSIPAEQRPYIGGSGDNTVLGLAINYNGLNRLGLNGLLGGQGNGGPVGLSGGQPGQESGSGMMGAPGEAGSAGSTVSGPGGSPGASGSTSGGPGGSPGMMPSSGQGPRQSSSGAQQSGIPGFLTGSSSGMGGGGGMNSGGTPGIFRVFREGLAGDISWLLVFAIIGVLAWARRPTALSLRGFAEAGYLNEKALVLLAMLLWLIPGLLYFSFTTGFWHDYYIATIAPPIAGLVGIGAAGMYQKYISGSRAGWLLVAAVLVTGLIQVLFLSYNADFAGPLIPLVLLGTLAGAGLLAGMQIKKSDALVKYQLPLVAVALGILIIAPLVWSCTPIMTGNGGTIPTAGPQGSQGGMGGMGSEMINGMAGESAFPGAGDFRTSGMGDAGEFQRNQSRGVSAMSGGPQGVGMGGDDTSTDALAQFLHSHTTNETWILAVPSAQTGANLIIETGKPVMCLGGFTGSDQVLNVTSLENYIHKDKVRYFETGGAGSGGMGGGNSEIFSWVATHCTAVPASEWGGSTTGTANLTGSDSLSLPGMTGSPGTMTGAGFPSGTGNATATVGGMSGNPGGGSGTLYDCLGAA
ncbi:MAG: ArnT family glycosyltransferase [Methanoregula sp.]|uniref:ArnT family glycosyltransferase n=2 Tax=Methanoregula sp. TaxID=2052170 RepID=UPI003C458B3D